MIESNHRGALSTDRAASTFRGLSVAGANVEHGESLGRVDVLRDGTKSMSQRRVATKQCIGQGDLT